MEVDAPRSAAQAKAKAERSEEDGKGFEFCEVCSRNHDQGHRHKYLPAHARALADLLARFHRNLSNPSPLDPARAALNGLWCVFCSCNLREISSNFGPVTDSSPFSPFFLPLVVSRVSDLSSNAIKHLASSEHLQSVKDFMRKHRGPMDRVDSFRVCEGRSPKVGKGHFRLAIGL